MAALADRVGHASSTSGSGTLTLGPALGAVSPFACSFQSISTAGITNGSVVSYLILDNNSNWEVGRGVYSSIGPTLTRGPLWSSNSGNVISLSGTAQVYISALAEDLSPNNGGMVNKFRNGTFDIWQRGTASSTITTAGAYYADGWIVTPTGASCAVAQASNTRVGANTLFGLKITGAASVTDVLCAQRIESYIAAQLAGKNATVQMWVYNSTGGSITPKISTLYPNAQDNWTSSTTDFSATNLQPCANNAWTQVAYTIPVSTNATAGYQVTIDFGNNFGSSSNYVIVAEADFRWTPYLPVELCFYPPPPELRPLANELIFCQRYFQTTYDLGTAPGTATHSGMVAQNTGNASNSNVAMGVTLQATMRTDPTISLWDGAGTSNRTSYFVVSWTDGFGSTGIVSASEHSFVWGSGAATTVPLFLHYTASAEL